MLKLDNTTAVAYINKIGGTISASCNKLAKDIWNWAKGQDIWITASHVPGIKYTTADLRSHLFYDNKEWSLNEKVAKSLFDRFGKPVIDLFASYLNTKCTKYASYKPDLDAYHVNAFSLCWLDLNSYIFPPFSIVGRVLANLAQDRETALVIVPCWETAMVPTIRAVGETRDNTTVDTSPSTPAPATRNKLSTPNLGSAQSGSSNFVGHIPTAGLSPDVAQIVEGQHTISI